MHVKLFNLFVALEWSAGANKLHSYLIFDIQGVKKVPDRFLNLM